MLGILRFLALVVMAAAFVFVSYLLLAISPRLALGFSGALFVIGASMVLVALLRG